MLLTCSRAVAVAAVADEVQQDAVIAKDEAACVEELDGVQVARHAVGVLITLPALAAIGGAEERAAAATGKAELGGDETVWSMQKKWGEPTRPKSQCRQTHSSCLLGTQAIVADCHQLVAADLADAAGAKVPAAACGQYFSCHPLDSCCP